MPPSLQLTDSLVATATQAHRDALEALLGMQYGEGYWWAELTADSTLESDYVLLQLWLHPPEDGVWNPPNRAQIERAAESIWDRQLQDGGFNIYPRGPSEISASVKAYTALKLAWQNPESGRMRRLRARILELGGLQAANSYTKVNLSLFGLYPRQHVPAVPPEIMLMGNLIYEMSSWTRAIVIPLSIVHAMNPMRPVPAGFNLNELLNPGVSLALDEQGPFFTWKKFFLAVDKFLKVWERFGSASVRQRAIKKAEAWMLERTKRSHGLAAIYPPMMYLIMALDLLGYAPDHPDREEAERHFNALMVDDGRRHFFQPCFSVVWDTAIAAHAVSESGGAPAEALRRAADWLITKEVRHTGDWAVKRPGCEPSGWYFEFANEFYPDIDDTAMVLLALQGCPGSDAQKQRAVQKRACDWLLHMQSKDGGWAAFDADNNWALLADVPFADHNAMLDPTCPDITGRVIEALCKSGVDRDGAAIRHGVEYLIRAQEADGSWFGRWGVDYIYGTFLALRGLQAAGESDREAHVLRGGEWLRSIQNGDGGWGESCASYDNHRFTPAGSTPSQTAWAVLGLIAGGDVTSSSVQKGIEYLADTQRSDGTWDEELATGTGFPGVFYLSYHLYRNSFPLLALSTFLKARNELDIQN